MTPRTGDEGWDVCIYIAGSLCCIAETSTTLESDYTPIKKIIAKKKKLFRNSLAVQRLGFGAFTAVVQVRSLLGEQRSHKLHDTGKKQIKILSRKQSPRIISSSLLPCSAPAEDFIPHSPNPVSCLAF